ncbi:MULTISPECIES: hypothetical protein [unclassified Luteimonas]|uniref:hypothetical protein n=1 Tax=unclassified Luteimonas TaxID=2629088 RepID=UPI0018F05BDF|nr:MULTISPECIES: hypothetical protein [unclassified Luteimonas]MBJ6981726.1 hypothetical protein [Luteimonas sp. MC1572]MBJ7575731.1 hypothetical protein [Luteimonas sp. MC1828]QQO03014.1 hypothetical protein JGR64_12790 [Luteimonas sp. MC1572]
MTPAPLLVSLHMPKTAGTSLAETLRAAFPEPGACQIEYVDQPMQYTRWCRRWRALRAGLTGRGVLPDGLACVHGHFLPVKFRIAAGAARAVRYVTWLREPVDRLASHYHYWMRDYDGLDPAQPLRNRVLRERWSFERFALGAEMRDLYHEYLWRFDPAGFDFIGITERYDEDLQQMARRFLGGTAVPAVALANPLRGESGYVISPLLRSRIEAHHARDVALYRRVLAGHRR